MTPYTCGHQHPVCWGAALGLSVSDSSNFYLTARQQVTSLSAADRSWKRWIPHGRSCFKRLECGRPDREEAFSGQRNGFNRLERRNPYLQTTDPVWLRPSWSTVSVGDEPGAVGAGGHVRGKGGGGGMLEAETTRKGRRLREGMHGTRWRPWSHCGGDSERRNKDTDESGLHVGPTWQFSYFLIMGILLLQVLHPASA
jgi:hypothetical protein